MSAFSYIDLYCERLGPGLLAEPLNAFSNAAFFIAGWVFWQHLRRLPQEQARELRALPWLMAAIGAGSVTFHMLAVVWAAYFDSAFIALFMMSFAALWARRVLRQPWAQAWLGAPLFGLFTGLITAGLIALRLPFLPSDVTLYVSAWLVIVALSALALPREPAAARWFFATAAVFTGSIATRQVDLPLCPSWPWGTHWGWHTLNGLALYLSARGLAATRAAR